MKNKMTPRYMLIGVFLFLLLSPRISSAQPRLFSPVPEDSVMLAGLLQKYQQYYQAQLEQLPSQYKKDLADVYQQRWKNIQHAFYSKEIYTDAVAQEYLNRLVGIIRKSNVHLSPDFTCYFSRSAVPNAAYIGEGIILFNMGLFEKLDNEGQVVFVLCHEISHFILRHSENSIREYVATINSEEVQTALHKIKGSEYRKHEQLQNLVKGLTFDSRRHSRDHEAQADSMAVELMRNTPYALSTALSAMNILNNIDKDTLNMASLLPLLFNAKEYPFRKKWLASDDGLLGGHAQLTKEEMADSLKTHPDCEKRSLLLARMMQSWSQPIAAHFVVDSVTFDLLKNRFRYETIEYAYLSDRCTESLLLTLELLNTKPNDMYLVAQVGKLFNALYAAQKSHTLSKISDLPAPDYPPNYNQLLQFIQNLYLEDLASISYYFLKQYQTQMDRYTPYRTAYQQSEKLTKN